MRRLLLLAATLAFACASEPPPAPAAPPPPKPAPPPKALSPLVEQVDDFGFYQVEAPSFGALSAREKRLAYWIAQSGIALDPIIYDQLSSHGVQEKRLVTALIEDPSRLPADSRDAIVMYAKFFLASRGNHNATTNRKFIPDVSFDAFKAAAHAASKAGAKLGDESKLDAMLDELKPAMFDPAFEPSPTNKNPPEGQDIITGSSNTFYGPGVTKDALEKWKDKEAHPLNSRVVLESGKLVEQPYRAGTPDGSVKPGLYAKELGAAIAALQNAVPEADEAEQKSLNALIKYYQTGDKADWIAFDIAWVQDDALVDFVNGFIETYRDARSAKGAAEALTCVKDKALSPLMQNLAKNALYFEQKAPWVDAYRKLDVKAPIGKAVEAIVETADFPMSIIGDNLPNEEEIHRQYGTKNFLITNASEAFNKTRGLKAITEFMPDDIPNYTKHGSMAGNLITAMHEIIGHGSGKSHTTKEPRETLKEYYSSLEEARADLVAYWNAADPKLSELGVKDQKEVANEIYSKLAMSIWGVLNHYPRGTDPKQEYDQAEEDHDRDRLMIWNWVAEHGGIGLVEKNGKHYVQVLDFEKTHKAVGELLAELMRIKGEGDYDAIKALVTKYGLHFDPKLRDEEITRFKTLGIPRFAAGIYGDMAIDKKGLVTMTYGRDFLKQQVEFARLNGTLGF